MQFSGFDWDRANRAKCQKHGVSIGEIEGLFDRPVAIVPDFAHSHSEERFKAVGLTLNGRGILVVFTWRRDGSNSLIRPVSARYMHKKELAVYEKEISRS